jgi:glycosyltransferase involved in cell wall biosynthesis
MKFIKKNTQNFIGIIFSVFFIFIILICTLYIRIFNSNNKKRMVWGSTPIINNFYWSKAMKNIGYQSECFTYDFFKSINKRSDWDRIIDEEYKWLPSFIRPYFAFSFSLFKYDIFVIPFSGYFIGHTYIKHFQSFLFKLANKKVIVIPFGSDSYVYRDIKSTSLLHGLLMSYPEAAKNQRRIASDVAYWVKNADCVIPGFMGPDGFGRWDLLIPSTLFIDLNLWQQSIKSNYANGIIGEVVIAHAPNHRGFKGSEFVIDAINRLKEEGLRIDFKVLERMQNDQVRQVFETEADILVEQIIATGHGLNGLEGMAAGLPTISNLEDETYILPLRRWSYFNECPLVSATPENLVDVLRKLVTRPELRHQIGQASREYVEKYHGLDSAQYMFSNVIDYVYGKKESLINLYHPLLGEYPNRSPKIQHPLVKNQIID